MRSFILGMLLTLGVVILIAADNGAPGLRINGQPAYELQWNQAWCQTDGTCRVRDAVTSYQANYVPSTTVSDYHQCPADTMSSYVNEHEYACNPVKNWVCADKTQTLLTAEDGSKHCISFQ